MMKLGDREVRLCLLDTNVVSEMVKSPEPLLPRFLRWALDTKPPFLPCFSLFTVIELRQSSDVFRNFIETFHHVPCVMLKGYEELLEEETALYPDPAPIDVCALAFTPLGGPGNLLRNLPTILRDPTLQARERYWNKSRHEIVDGMVSLVPNYPAESGTYTRKEVRTFIEIAGFSQLVLRQRLFAETMVGREVAVDIDAFPSVKASLYTAFHKFYVDSSRRASKSDAFDIIIAANTPYVEAIVTENHQADVLRKVKRLDRFIDELMVFTLRDFRSKSPGDVRLRRPES